MQTGEWTVQLRNFTAKARNCLTRQGMSLGREELSEEAKRFSGGKSLARRGKSL